MMQLNIVPECYVDTKVAEIVGSAPKGYNHQHGCGNVASQLKNKLKDKFALGIIDEDKGKGPSAKYFSEFRIIRQENNLILKKHVKRKQYLILICPEVEKWLLNDANIAGINPEEFKLAKDLAGLKQITKIKSIDKDKDFYRFIKKMVQAKAPAITTLKYWIFLFKDNQLDTFKAD